MISKCLDELTIEGHDSFFEAGIEVYDACLDLIRARKIRFISLPGVGLSRLWQLVHWDLDERVEYIDNDQVGADQLMHLGLHLALDTYIDKSQPTQWLWAECAASAVDLFVLGHLLRHQQEPAFVQSTLESIAFYDESYAHEPDDGQRIVQLCMDAPMDAMGETVDYLYQLGLALLSGTPSLERADSSKMSQHYLYPLAHHFNLANWVLFLKARFPSIEFGAHGLKEQILKDDSSLLQSVIDAIDR